MKFFSQNVPLHPEAYLEKEWLVSNGLGGYSSNSLACIPTRKYHGLLIAALPFIGRTVMLNHLQETLILPDGQEIILNPYDKPNQKFDVNAINHLDEFYLDQGLPVWRYRIDGIVFEKRLVMTHQQNTVHVIYKLIDGPANLKLKLSPFVHFRSTNLAANDPVSMPYTMLIEQNHYEIFREGFPPLRLYFENKNFTLQEQILNDIFFREESFRGYECVGQCFSPGFWVLELTKNTPHSLIASTQSWEEITALNSLEALDAELMRRKLLLKLAPPQARRDFGAELILAADQFIMMPISRIQDKTRAIAKGEEVLSIIAGYHWFTDWGRDTMISLEGLTLCTGRLDEARYILRTFSYYIKHGLIPNMFPEGENQGLYHTADATLWFFHSLHRYLEQSQDFETLDFLMPKLLEIYDNHIKGTLFGIRVDPSDGLLIQGAEGYQLTWMDAKVGDWVVTPRRGKAVEINALWYNALKLLASWLQNRQPMLAKSIEEQAEKTKKSFNEKFWNPDKGYLYDVIETENGNNDDALRPNQLFAISLDYPVLETQYWHSVFDTCKEKLLTPVGMRSLSPDHPDYKSRYDGDLHSRDAAYHQGTIWTWLIGAYIDCWLKIHPEEKGKAHEFVLGFEQHLLDAGIGYISEIFDANEPYNARGCIAQAWSIAEVLRCFLKTLNNHDNIDKIASGKIT